MAAALLGPFGCGKIEFVPSPFVPSRVEAAYAADEDITRLRWRVAQAGGLTFELRDGATFRPIDFTTAPYPSGPFPCGDATCFQLALRSPLARPADDVVLRSREGDLGTFLGEKGTWYDARQPAIALTATLAQDVSSYSVAVDDWLTAPGLERRFRVTLWSEPVAPCVARPDIPDATLEAPPGDDLPFSAPLTDDGRYCVRVRPHPLDDGQRAAATATLVTAPLVLRELKSYQPPVEESPIVWRLVTDLQVVDPQRCTEVMKTTESTFADAFSSRGVSHALAAVDLAPGCMQKAGRAIDAGPLADEAKAWLAANYQNRYHRPILVYINNLVPPLPPSLTMSLQTWRDSFDGSDSHPLVVAMATGAALQSYPWDVPMQFVAIEDPQFSTTIKGVAQQFLPFKSQLHSNDQVIPLMPALTVDGADGLPWKLCHASPQVRRFTGTTPIPDNELTPLIRRLEPPGFTVEFPEKILIPSQQFQRDTVVIRYEICRRFCDHPFRDEAGVDRPAWTQTPVCVRNSVP